MHAFTASNAQVLAGYLIFLASYLVFAIGKFPGWKIDRPGVAIIGAALMFAFRILGPGDALRYINFATLVLLFAMMLLVGNLRLAGFFDRVAAFAMARLGRHHLLPAVSNAPSRKYTSAFGTTSASACRSPSARSQWDGHGCGWSGEKPKN